MKRLFTVIMAALIAWFFRPVYMNGMQCNWLLLWIIIGLPFGFRRLMILIPRGSDLGATIGTVALCIILGGLFGGLVLIAELIDGFFFLFRRRTRR